MSLSLSAASSLPDLALRPAQGTLSPPDAAGAGDGDFASLLRNLAGNTVSTVREGEGAALAGIQGNLPLQTVVERVMAAERTLQAALAVRDKVVSSYLEISRMQI
jgi:flagellar hook-basal body complex protein FliE